ncbi:Vps5 like protein [Opisthorchis viverrini]|uniref:Vps5 like protein n=1 Tax=Opisthorchis viverrini TaxID=6198 RepID=A0A1S8X7X3_OPIVI|nr:Vps5 like protein [Opisthorchis viverrini]
MEGQNNEFGHESPACVIDEQDLSCSHFIQSVANLELDQCSPPPVSDPVRNGVKTRDEVPEKPKIYSVRVTDPVKVGDGMGAYIVYHVIFNVSASAKKIFKNVGDAIGKIAYKMEDPDDYFDLKFEELESWERQLKRLHSALSLLVSSNQDLASSKFTVSRTISQLANVEEHTGLAQALGRLADTEEEVSQQHAVLAEAELTYLVDFARDTLGMIQACKDALDERVKAFRNWKTAEALLRMKREQKVRLELAGRYDQRKMVGLDAEIDETTKRVEQEQERFNNISSIIKVEMERVDLTRFDDLKQAATDFLEVMLQNQEKHLETWEAYLLRARSIN